MPLLPPGMQKRKSGEEVEVDEPEEKRRTLCAMASTVTRKVVFSENAPAAIGPYSQAIRAGNTIYCSGSLGMDPKTGALKEGLTEQTHQSLKNLGAVLKAAGVDYKNVVKTTVLLSDINNFAAVNEIYKEYFSTPFPARAAYAAAGLPKNALVEIEAVAVDNLVDE